MRRPQSSGKVFLPLSALDGSSTASVAAAASSTASKRASLRSSRSSDGLSSMRFSGIAKRVPSSSCRLTTFTSCSCRAASRCAASDCSEDSAPKRSAKLLLGAFSLTWAFSLSIKLTIRTAGMKRSMSDPDASLALCNAEIKHLAMTCAPSLEQARPSLIKVKGAESKINFPAFSGINLSSCKKESGKSSKTARSKLGTQPCVSSLTSSLLVVASRNLTVESRTSKSVLQILDMKHLLTSLRGCISKET